MLGGAVGAFVRVSVIQALSIHWPGLPLGMLTVNIFGSFILGFVYLPLSHWQFHNLKYFLIGGLLGALTTFSTFALDVYLLWNQRRLVEALSFGLIVPLLSIIAVFIGAWFSQKILVL